MLLHNSYQLEIPKRVFGVGGGEREGGGGSDIFLFLYIIKGG